MRRRATGATHMSVSQKKILGSLGIAIYLLVYVIAATGIGARLTTSPQWLQFFFFAFAGIAWIAPLKPVFGWMNTPPHNS
jgi:membrane protein implicated in regulation of membrane protease activity